MADETASATRPDEDDVNGSAVRTGNAPVTDECRRLAELLNLDAVGVVSSASGRRRVAWWAAPGSPALPSRLDDILGGRVEGWIVCPAGEGSVFARMTPTSSVRSASILKALGPSFVAAVAGEPSTRPEENPRPARAFPPGTGEAERDAIAVDDVRVLDRVAEAVRKALESPDVSTADLLEAARQALGADELFFLSERGEEIEVVAVPDGDWPRRIPPEVRAEFSGIALAIDDGTARQLGVVLGARTAQLSGGFCSETGPMEAVIAGWEGHRALPEALMRVVARIVGAGRAALAAGGRGTEALMTKQRTRWAYEIHDGVTQVVTTAVLELEGLRRRIEEDPQEAIRILDVVKAELRKTLEQLRGILFDLSEEPAPMEDESLEGYVQDVVRRWRLPADVSVQGELKSIPKPVREAAYVVIRESLANAAKHASSCNVAVRVRTSGEEVEVEVEDGGRGFDTAGAGRRARHFGLEMMKRRVEEVNGTLDVESSPGKGTRVVARLPVRGQGEKP